MATPYKLGQMDVIIAGHFKKEVEVKRTWFERLFTIPFNPIKKTKTVTELFPSLEDGQTLRYGNSLMMNQKTFNELDKHIKQNK